MPAATYSVNPLTAVKLPWLVRRKLQSVRRKGKAGLLLYGIIRTGSRSMSRKQPVVSVGEGNNSLGMCSSHSRLPKWCPLAPGTHDLLFLASRWVSSSSLRARVSLLDGDVLVAVCEPVQPWTIYAKRPAVDTWYLGVIDSAGEIRPLE